MSFYFYFFQWGFRPRNFSVEKNSLHANLKNVNENSICQTVPNFCFICLFYSSSKRLFFKLLLQLQTNIQFLCSYLTLRFTLTLNLGGCALWWVFGEQTSRILKIKPFGQQGGVE